MVKTPHLRCMGSEFDPWSRELRSHMAAAWPKNFEKNTGHEMICISYSSKEDQKKHYRKQMMEGSGPCGGFS